jgi:beta-adrenergic-receptor kinase
MRRYLEKMGEVKFEKIFNQRLGYLQFKEFCERISDDNLPCLKFYEDIKKYQKIENFDERKKLAREIYDNFIMKELLSNSYVSQISRYYISRYFICTLYYRAIRKML